MTALTVLEQKAVSIYLKIYYSNLEIPDQQRQSFCPLYTFPMDRDTFPKGPIVIFTTTKSSVERLSINKWDLFVGQSNLQASICIPEIIFYYQTKPLLCNWQRAILCRPCSFSQAGTFLSRPSLAAWYLIWSSSMITVTSSILHLHIDSYSKDI